MYCPNLCIDDDDVLNLTPEDVSRIRPRPLSPYTIIASLTLFKEAFGFEFKLKVDEETLGLYNNSDDEEREMA